MDIKPTNQQPISDDQELAKVLAGITAGVDSVAPDNLANDLDQEVADTAVADDDDSQSTQAVEAPAATPAPSPAFTMPAAPVAATGLEAIKHDALQELRPLVDKLNLSAEEKFDTYLLLIRSTDDTTLVAPAFEAARGIADESGKAQALLDIVKEIDYLSNPHKQAA